MASLSQFQIKTPTDHGRRFGSLLEKYIQRLYKDLSPEIPRLNGPNAPFPFNETNLKNYILSQIEVEEGCDLWFELDVLKDVEQAIGERIDYAYLPKSFKPDASNRTKRGQVLHNISDMMATFEVKGPARKNLWTTGGNFWTKDDGNRGIKTDIEKQLARSLKASSTQHFIALIAVPPKVKNLNIALAGFLERVNKETEAQLTEYYRSEMEDVQGLLLFVYRVTPKDGTKDTIAP